MDSDFWVSFAVPVVIALIGSGGSYLTVRAQIRKMNSDSNKGEAEAGHIEAQGQNIVVGGAVSVVEMLRGELESERTVRRQMVDELRHEIEQERKARRVDAQRCEAEIQLRDTEIAILKRELNKLNRKMNAHEASIKKLKSDTDDLATRTPPPHAIPADPTPPIPTRSTFQDAPSDQPPDDAD